MALILAIVLPLAAEPVSAATACTGVTAGTSLDDCGYETPAVGNSYVYRPTGTPWVFSGEAGVTGNGSPFTFGQVAPEGTQVGFIQIDGIASQVVSGWQSDQLYILTLSAAQRVAGCLGPCGPEHLNLLLDGQLILDFTVANGAYADFTTAPFATTAGLHTLTIEGVNPPFEVAGDDTAFVDALRLTSTPPAVPTSSEMCKNNGWRQVHTAAGARFTNQGDCVSYVASGGRSDSHS